MIPDQISQAVRRIQGGQGSQQDIKMVTDWYNQNQNSLDTGTSAAISSALGRGRAIAGSSQIGLGNQPNPLPYTKPGTPAGLPPSGGSPLLPAWANASPMTRGIPATQTNLEAAANAGFSPSSLGSKGEGQGESIGTGQYTDTNPANLYNPGSITRLEANPERAKELFSYLPDNPGGAGLAANSTLGEDFNPDNVDIARFYQDLTKGTGLEGMSPAAIDMLVNDPQMFAALMSDQAGGGPNTEAFLEPRAKAALQMAGIGMLGHGTHGAPGTGLPGQNLTSGPASDVDKALAAQAFMDQFNQPGSQFVDVNGLYQESFNRAMNTDFEGLRDQNGNPLGIDGSIQLTNEALMAAAPFMSQEAQAWLSSTLSQAALQYKLEVGKGNISMSYPSYLKTLGIDQMLASS